MKETGLVVGFIGKCPVKGCRTLAKVNIPGVGKTITKGYRHQYQAKVISAAFHPWQLFLHCVEHRRDLNFKRIEGTYNPQKSCDARCMNATGPNCECSCGGANHGGKYLIQVI